VTEDRDPWWEHWFGEPYLALYPEREERESRTQAVFAREVLAPFTKAGRLRFLDLGCGTGRRTAALDEGLGATTGLDASLRLVGVARRREPRWKPGALCARAERLPLAARSVGAAVSFSGAFGRTDDPADDARVACEVARVLAPGGALLAAVFNAERVVAGLARREEKLIAGTRVVITRRYDPARRMLEKEIELGSGAEKRVYAQRARALTEHELRGRLRAAGLTILGSWGDFDGSAFERGRSPRLVLLASRPTSKAFAASPPGTAR
jgi:SAM-dependent methyltransferase